MEAFGIYLLKCSGILLLFWANYHLFLKQETLFKENRWYLFSGILLSLIFPFFKLKKIVAVDLVPTMDTSQVIDGEFYTAADTSFGLTQVLLITYLAGIVFFTVRFLLHLKRINRLTIESETWKEDDLRHVRTKKSIAPFSFFKSLFYNPKQFQKEELQLILSHEKVHAKEWHSVDVILGELLKIVLWFNPIVWFYHKSIKQNLEFLADASAISSCNRKSYQLLMVRQATGQQLELSNSFYNSLIKKRIVMLNKEQSRKTKVYKSFLIIPLLALFLVGFNTEKVYQFQKINGVATTETDKTVELKIDKNTTEEALLKMKKDLADNKIDFSYTTVRNDAREIIDISIQISGKNDKGETFSGNYASNSEGPINPLVIFYDDEANLLSVGDATSRRIKINADGNHTMLWSGMDEIGEHEDIVVIEKRGSKKVILNGREINKDSLQSKGFNYIVSVDENDGSAEIHALSEEAEEVLEEKVLESINGKDDLESVQLNFSSDEDEDGKSDRQFKIKKKKSKKGKQVMIMKDSDDDSDIEVMNSDEGFFFIDTEGKDPLYIIDGKEASKKEVKKLSPKQIATIDVSKGKAAIKKYGKKAKDGVVEIITKKKN